MAGGGGGARGGGRNLQRPGRGQRRDCFERDGDGGDGAAERADGGDLPSIAVDGGARQTPGADAIFRDGEPDRGEESGTGTGAGRVYSGKSGSRDAAAFAGAERAGGTAAGVGRGSPPAWPSASGGPRRGRNCKPVIGDS